MKNLFCLVIVVFTLLYLSSCTTKTFYQICQVSPVVKDNNLINQDSLFYEDNNCKVFYDFWSDGGNVGFKFYNKSEKDIIVDLEKSFFILNGVAYNYFKNRTFSSVDNLISFNEEKKMCIPPHAAKVITEYEISTTIYRDCDLFKFPKRKQIKTKAFKHNASPYAFSNRISYSIGNSLVETNISHEFYVSAITNYPEKEVLKSTNLEFCDQESATSIPYIKDAAINKFYIKYNNAHDKWKH